MTSSAAGRGSRRQRSGPAKRPRTSGKMTPAWRPSRHSRTTQRSRGCPASSASSRWPVSGVAPGRPARAIRSVPYGANAFAVAPPSTRSRTVHASRIAIERPSGRRSGRCGRQHHRSSGTIHLSASARSTCRARRHAGTSWRRNDLLAPHRSFVTAPARNRAVPYRSGGRCSRTTPCRTSAPTQPPPWWNRRRSGRLRRRGRRGRIGTVGRRAATPAMSLVSGWRSARRCRAHGG